jgi:hypothetical protein
MPSKENSNKCLKIRLSSNKAEPPKKQKHQIRAQTFIFAPNTIKNYLLATILFIPQENGR